MERYAEYEKASDILFKKGDYNNSCVCLYYSALHRMMYAIVHDPKHPKDYDSLNPLNEDIHDKIYHQICNKLTNRRDEGILKDSFGGLIKLRHKADYEQESLTQDEYFNAKQFHTSLMNLLQTRFPV